MDSMELLAMKLNIGMVLASFFFLVGPCCFFYLFALPSKVDNKTIIICGVVTTVLVSTLLHHFLGIRYNP